MTEETQTPEMEQTTEETQGPSLGIQDLFLLANCVEVASTRGAYKANELSTVGSVYDKLKVFLDAHRPAEEEEGEAETGEEDA